jgi:E3 ubiquitin-protein ligase Mdm2
LTSCEKDHSKHKRELKDRAREGVGDPQLEEVINQLLCEAYRVLAGARLDNFESYKLMSRVLGGAQYVPDDTDPYASLAGYKKPGKLKPELPDKHNIEMEAKDAIFSAIIAARDVTIAERGDMLEDLGKALQLERANVAAAGVALEAANARIGQMDRRSADAETLCVVCFVNEKNATIVHGDTGHVACCLECARILQDRGDGCPICRAPIERVIRQFNV